MNALTTPFCVVPAAAEVARHIWQLACAKERHQWELLNKFVEMKHPELAKQVLAYGQARERMNRACDEWLALEVRP